MEFYRIELSPLPTTHDSRAENIKHQIHDFLKMDVKSVRSRDVYTIAADITPEEAQKIAGELVNPVLQQSCVGQMPVHNFDYMVCVGFRPGVTDNVGRTAHEAAGDIIGRTLRHDEHVFSSVEYFLQGEGLTAESVQSIASGLLANVLIETVTVLSAKDVEENGIKLNVPLVEPAPSGIVKTFDLEVSDEALLQISRQGVLVLTLQEMQCIRDYYRRAKNRAQLGLSQAPTDVELEVLAQTWSEHCKHKIFSAEIAYEDTVTGEKETIDSLFKSYIKRSTREIEQRRDDLLSLFWDNAGVIRFNDYWNLAYKVETHNSPSALDPYGGAMTGIVGVNRDPMGTGMGAYLLSNVWGYCLGSPFTKSADVPEGLLHPRRLRDGVHRGVIDGGNQSGIPYGCGWEYFDERYIGKPLVYCGTVGVLPATIGNQKGHEKSIRPGDIAVMVGGRVGKDGIHGATFSSEELHAKSPTHAVQIGDPITQKKVGDFMYEARDKMLYRFVTDNGAGGLSSSIGEMATFSGGAVLDLQKVPTKYAGLQPWEILVSEAQERMSFAVPPEHLDAFLALAAARSVEATVIGAFTDDGLFKATWGEKVVCALEMEFMHEGLPKLHLKGTWVPPKHDEPDFAKRDVVEDVTAMLSQLNICSDEFKARQYDHEVKGLSVIKPFCGAAADVQSDATVTMIEPLSHEGFALSMSILPRYADIDTYAMIGATLDAVIRKMLAVGTPFGRMAVLDNFCWPDPVQSEKTPDGEYKMAQLVRANKALYDYTTAFDVPCISGKDSMKNDSTRGGRKISIPPSVLFSGIAKVPEIAKAQTLDVKFAGDCVYSVGMTRRELGGSEYFNMLGATGNAVPQLDSAAALKIYHAIADVTDRQLADAVHAPVLGGYAVGLAKMAMAGRLGLDIDLSKIPQEDGMSELEVLFSESACRFLLTCRPAQQQALEQALKDVPFACIGHVTLAQTLKLNTHTIALDKLINAYKKTLAGI